MTISVAPTQKMEAKDAVMTLLKKAAEVGITIKGTEENQRVAAGTVRHI